MGKKATVIEVEGTDGAGKTTALKYLIEQIRATGKTVLETREVGSPLLPVCVKLRELVLDPASNLSDASMEFIFAAMRLENQKYYASVADQYDYIISDRGWLSHLAYTDNNVNKEFTQAFYKGVVQHMTELPDVVIYLDVDTEVAMKRRVKRGGAVDVIEMKGDSFQQKVRGSFEDHIDDLILEASENDKRVNVFEVDANDNVEGVRYQVDQIIKQLQG